MLGPPQHPEHRLGRWWTTGSTGESGLEDQRGGLYTHLCVHSAARATLTTVTLSKNEVSPPCPLTWKSFVNLVLPVCFSASLPGTQDDRTEPQAARENILPARGPSNHTHEQTVPTYSPFLCLQLLPPFHLHPPVLTTLDGNDPQATEVDTKSSILAFSQKTPRNALGGREMYILDHLTDHR